MKQRLNRMIELEPLEVDFLDDILRTVITSWELSGRATASDLVRCGLDEAIRRASAIRLKLNLGEKKDE